MLTVYRWDGSARKGRWFETAAVRDQLSELRATTDLLWIDLDRPTDDDERLIFDELVRVHSLTREDVTRERRDPKRLPHLPKVEEFADYLFVIVNPLHPKLVEQFRCRTAGGGHDQHQSTQLSAVLTESRLLTYHVESLACVQALRAYLDRHAEQCGRGPDFLFHLILDEMVDEYAPVLDAVTESLDGMEEDIFRRPVRAAVPRLLHLKRDILALRKTLVYEREVLARLSRGEFELIDDRETVYYRNVYDHLVRFTELIESSREMVSDLMESHLSATSNRLNEVMKVLTMISTVVLPMTLVAGVYGMNFDHMPEIHWPYGYPFALGLMLLAGLLPLAIFKWRKWF
jgi:magnesium transporter